MEDLEKLQPFARHHYAARRRARLMHYYKQGSLLALILLALAVHFVAVGSATATASTSDAGNFMVLQLGSFHAEVHWHDNSKPSGN